LIIRQHHISPSFNGSLFELNQQASDDTSLCRVAISTKRSDAD